MVSASELLRELTKYGIIELVSEQGKGKGGFMARIAGIGYQNFGTIRENNSNYGNPLAFALFVPLLWEKGDPPTG